MPRPRARAAMLEDLRGPVIGGDQDVGEGFVVAQQHVEARSQALDQIGLEQQRLCLGAGDDEFERPRRSQHALDAGIEAGRTGVGGNAFLDILGLAHIEHVAARIDHAIDAGLRWRVLGGVENGGAADGKRALSLLEAIFGIALLGRQKLCLLVLLDDLDVGLDVFLRNAHACRLAEDSAAADRKFVRKVRCARVSNVGSAAAEGQSEAGRQSGNGLPRAGRAIAIGVVPINSISIESFNDNTLVLLSNSQRFNIKIAINSFSRTGLVLRHARFFVAALPVRPDVLESRHETSSGFGNLAGDDGRGGGRRFLRAFAAWSL